MPAARPLPHLRSDLKVSRQVQSEKVNYVVKDPIKGEYFRFEESEWRVIELFSATFGGGTEVKMTQAEALAEYNSRYPLDPIDISVLTDFEKSLGDMNLLVKSSKEMNVMLIEKMKETRKSMLLSKKGSLMYKRFPLVDPDKYFNQVVPRLWFFWTKGFLLLSVSTMIFAMILVGYRLEEFSNGVYEVFSFSKMSFWNLAFLWVTIYTVIAIHELGHGMTCKRYGGEVHEIGFLLLFFQPCLYANVNDAWLFDKKWKQVLVTVAGGYIEFFVGSLFAILWAISNPNTLINVLSLQVMTICSLSTVIFNFNPLVKLDGYYLLADFLEIPNLRDASFGYLKWIVRTKIFRMADDGEGDVSPRESRIFFVYGLLSFGWVASTTLGLFYLAKGFLIDFAQGIGVLVSLWVAYKLFGGHVKKVGKFLVQWAISNRTWLVSGQAKWSAVGLVSLIVLVCLFPVPYFVPGRCRLQAAHTEVIRASAEGVLQKYYLPDGSEVREEAPVFKVENPSIETDLSMAELQLSKLEIEERATVKTQSGSASSLAIEKEAKRGTVEKLKKKIAGLEPKARRTNGEAIISCPDQAKKLGTFVKEGDEICRLHSIATMKAVIEVPEQEVAHIKVGDNVQFRVEALPLKTYKGEVHRIQSLGIPDPTNPKAHLYNAEILIDNTGDLRPGMSGLARVRTGSVSVLRFVGRRLASFFRLDLFF